jgi:hypothetical protein
MLLSDGRCYPTERAENADHSMELEEIKQRDDMLDAAIKTGDHADLSAIIKRRQNDSLNQSAMRDPYDHASPANIAYMQVQDSVNSGVTALVHPKDDPALKRLMDHISAKYPRGGSVASKIKDRPLQQAEIQQFSGKLIPGLPPLPPSPSRVLSSPCRARGARGFGAGRLSLPLYRTASGTERLARVRRHQMRKMPPHRGAQGEEASKSSP